MLNSLTTSSSSTVHSNNNKSQQQQVVIIEDINEQQAIHQNGDVITTAAAENRIDPHRHQEQEQVHVLSNPKNSIIIIEKENALSTKEPSNNNDNNQQSNKTIAWIHALFGHSLFAVLLLIAAGSAVSFQSGMNAAMRATAGRAFSSVTNFASGTLACLLLFILDLLLLRTPPPSCHYTLKESPWYAWTGGVLGTFYIIVNIFLVPIHGAGTVLSIFVCAQVIAACIMDHFGLTGIKKRRYSLWRMLASLGLIGCVAVITLF